MPIMQCTLPNGKKGYKYGKSGKCYASRASAEKQMKAIKNKALEIRYGKK